MLADPGDVAGGQLEVVEAVAVALGQLPGVGVGDGEAAVPVVRGAARVPPPVVTLFQPRQGELSTLNGYILKSNKIYDISK